MKKVNHKEVKGSSPAGTQGVDFKQLIAKSMGAPHFYMRLVDISPGGHTERHAHEWEHELFVVEGRGRIELKDRREDIIQGDAIFVERNELHEFVNSSKSPLRLICLIPKPSED